MTERGRKYLSDILIAIELLEHSQQIVGFRNRLIHAYDSIDHSIVWVILKRYLFPLKEEVIEKV